MSTEKRVTLFVNDIRDRYGLSINGISYRIRSLDKNKHKQSETGILVGKKQGIWIVQGTNTALDNYFQKKPTKNPYQKKNIEIFPDKKHFILKNGDDVYRINESELKEIYVKNVLPTEDFSKILHRHRKAILYHYLKMNKKP
jgi:hypothetical protein